jgi:hypothetical protein
MFACGNIKVVSHPIICTQHAADYGETNSRIQETVDTTAEKRTTVAAKTVSSNAEKYDP